MKVLHIIGGELDGGAARGAYWLHSGLGSIGVESAVFTNSINTLGDNSVITSSKTKADKVFNILRSQADNIFCSFYRKRKRVIFSTGCVGVDFTKTTEYRDADIIHLHWINAGLVNIRHLNKVKKPIIWTFRDMWPMTGGCHYSLDCEKYLYNCGNCPQLGGKHFTDLSYLVLKRKRKYIPKNLKIVAISHWLTDCAKKSSLFRGYDVRTIHNNIDTKVFFPIEKQIAVSGRYKLSQKWSSGSEPLWG